MGVPLEYAQNVTNKDVHAGRGIRVSAPEVWVAAPPYQNWMKLTQVGYSY